MDYWRDVESLYRANLDPRTPVIDRWPMLDDEHVEWAWEMLNFNLDGELQLSMSEDELLRWYVEQCTFWVIEGAASGQLYFLPFIEVRSIMRKVLKMVEFERCRRLRVCELRNELDNEHSKRRRRRLVRQFDQEQEKCLKKQMFYSLEKETL